MGGSTLLWECCRPPPSALATPPARKRREWRMGGVREGWDDAIASDFSPHGITQAFHFHSSRIPPLEPAASAAPSPSPRLLALRAATAAAAPVLPCTSAALHQCCPPRTPLRTPPRG
ncbi:unnamed protein product [Closterium sp. NIES-53]